MPYPAQYTALFHHHFTCPIMQQYAHLHRYNFKRAGQQGPTRTVNTNSCPKTCNKTGTGYSITHIQILQTRKLEKHVITKIGGNKT